MNVMNMLNAYMNVCFLPLYDKLSCMHVLVQIILFQHFMYIHVHGAVARMVNAMVASSSPVRGLGMLHCGIKAHVVAWAGMDCEDVVTEAGLPSAQQRSEIYDRKFLEIFFFGKICLSA